MTTTIAGSPLVPTRHVHGTYCWTASLLSGQGPSSASLSKNINNKTCEFTTRSDRFCCRLIVQSQEYSDCPCLPLYWITALYDKSLIMINLRPSAVGRGAYVTTLSRFLRITKTPRRIAQPLGIASCTSILNNVWNFYPRSLQVRSPGQVNWHCQNKFAIVSSLTCLSLRFQT